MELVLISGLSGSGKSVALNLLEDSGYYCVDNLPVVMLTVLVACSRKRASARWRSPSTPAPGTASTCCRKMQKLKEGRASTNLPVPAFATRKRCSSAIPNRAAAIRWPREDQTLVEAIRAERTMLEPISGLGHRIDTSGMKANGLREWVRQFIEVEPGQGLTLMFESFGFKHGIPLDADLVFDVRCLPNPHYDPELRPLTGKDAPVIAFLEAEAEVVRMRDDIARFVATWLPATSATTATT
jgi:UPF0042 nucleotide-binding protein